MNFYAFPPSSGGAAASSPVSDWSGGSTEIVAADWVDISTEDAGATAPVSSGVTDGRAWMQPTVSGLSAGNAASGMWLKEGASETMTGDFTVVVRLGAHMRKSHNMQTNMNMATALCVMEKGGASWAPATDAWHGVRRYYPTTRDGADVSAIYHNSLGWSGTWFSAGLANLTAYGPIDLCLHRVGTSLDLYVVGNGGALDYVYNRTLTAASETRVVIRGMANDADGQISVIARDFSGWTVTNGLLVAV